MKKLLAAGHSIELAVTQPDRPIGRGREFAVPPVKRLAIEAGISVAQPERIRNNGEFRGCLEAIRPEAIVVVAYGRIIPKWMLDLPPMGNLNLHASILPKYRGAAPIQWAIARGETMTGATTMRLDEGLDTGEILLQKEIAIAPGQTAQELAPILAASGADLMAETLEGIGPGSAHPIQPRTQDDRAASLAPILKREDALVDFSRPAHEIYNRWRGFQPWPGAYSFLKGRKLILHRVVLADSEAPGSAAGAVPGEIAVESGRIFAVAGKGSRIEILELQWEGKKRLGAAEFLRGAPGLQ
ncbi:MAG: methionyl-tRNA formyltransferase, partial [Bryobacteraceae bacterium]